MKRLTEAQAKEYAAEGCTHPVRVFSAAQAAHYLSCLEAGERSMGAEFNWYLKTIPLTGHVNRKMALAAVKELFAIPPAFTSK